jgi:general secretion pathway protein F
MNFMTGHDLLIIAAAFGPVLLGIAVLTAQRLIAGDYDSIPDDPVNFVLTLIGWVLIAVGLFGALAYQWIMCVPVWVPMMVISVIVMVQMVRRVKAGRQCALLELMAASVERSIPLKTVLEAFAHEQGGSLGRRAVRLARRLAAGESLPDALRRCRRLLPPDTLPVIRVGCESGALPAALRRAADIREAHGTLGANLTGKICYLAMLPLFAYAVVAFLMIQIAPAYGKIFRDFNMELPELTQRVIDFSCCVARSPLFTLLNLAMFLFSCYVAARWFRWIRWDPPVVRRLLWRLDSANILDALALAARGQRPLPEAILSLAGDYPKRAIRRRLRRAAADVAGGGDWTECLRRRGLLRRADVAILQAAQRAGNLAWALHETAESGRRRFAYRLQALVQLAYPPVIILFGLVVLSIVAAFFWPLVTLIQDYAVRSWR